MTLPFTHAMRHAMRATHGGDPAEATRIIQAALAAAGLMAAPDDGADSGPTRAPSRRPERRLIDPDAEIVGDLDDSAAPQPSAHGLPSRDRLRLPLGAVVKALRDGAAPSLPGGLAQFGLSGLNLSGAKLPGMSSPAQTLAPPPSLPEGARFEARSFACAAGSRAYKLYIPASAPLRPRGLVLMLHGCTQNPDDFARGAAMNAAAEAHGLAVAYPAQTGAHNAQSCWNWFNPADQRRGAGEPAILAGIVQAVSAEFSIAPGAALVAGLSAGGAMAVVMGETYPELFAAVGVHSGLPYGAADDVMSAFAAMRGDPRDARPATVARVRTIVFHGAADHTVHPSNAGRIIAAAFPGDDAPARRETGRAPGGRAWTRTVRARPGAAPHAEAWLIEGAGHAWSGGHPSGSYTDPAGPDASAEMARFFIEGLASGGAV